MTVNRRMKMWSSLSALALIQSGTMASLAEPLSADDPHAPTFLAGFEGEGEGGEGEGGEGGEGTGGEFGVDPSEAAQNPVAYLTALAVIRAHYLAGQAAYQAGDSDAAAELFAHPIVEIYADLEPVFLARGADSFEQQMADAAGAALAGASLRTVDDHIATVTKAIDATAALAPDSSDDEITISLKVAADLIERAALQYSLVRAGNAGEAYLDGYGFYKAAGSIAASIEKSDSETIIALNDALSVLGQAFPSVPEPESHQADPGALLAASSKLRLLAGA